MDTYRIALLVGSLRRESYNRQLALALARMAPQEFAFEHVRLDDLPPYDQDLEGNPPQSVKRLKGAIAAAQGVLFATPEYNRSIPGVLKNAIDHGSRPYGQSVWAGKPAGIVGCSVGAIGTAAAQQHLRNVLAYLDMPVLGQPECFVQFKDGLFGENGQIGIEKTKLFLQTWIDRYVDWVRRHND